MNAANDNNIIYVHTIHTSLNLSNSSKLTFLTVTLLHLKPDPQTYSRVPGLTLGQILKHIGTHTLYSIKIIDIQNHQHILMCFMCLLTKQNAAFKQKDPISGFPVSPGSVETLIR